MESKHDLITLPNGKTIKGIIMIENINLCPYVTLEWIIIETGLFIKNTFVESVDKKRFETINPSTGKVITNVAEASSKDVDLAVEAATEAFYNVWRFVDGKERGRLLNKLADLIERDLEELAALESFDNGQTLSTAKFIDVGKFAYTRHEPIGVCAAIIPWNFPILMQSWKMAPALACGNTIILKPSELTPLGALKIAALCKEAGFPEGVVNVLNGPGPITGAAIAMHMKIDKLSFTGSNATGRSLLKAASESNLKQVSLELGGKSPNIIFADSNLDQAIKWAHMGIFFNHGQCCTAGSRVYVQDSVYDEFLTKFKAFTESNKIGDPFEEDTYQGPQISQTQFDRIMRYIECGKEEGATLLTGGERHGDQGYFIKPTIFTDVNEKMTIMQEEIFGPVVAISKFSTVEEVIEKAHLTKFGLAAAVFTNDLTKAIKLSNELRAGTVWVNCYNLVNSRLPFGGYKESGTGRDLSKYALDQYTQIKTVQINLESHT
ncbi:17561_t:CDS:2 [Gigaspora margarita]|uniref:17561_t:CDS:1 n=1 Tax=Gigaspora margarita TaxID=4874 RepID=A0ABN7UM99_GIGMA|nr:17561_t:CDS:2 [Gigaspora margarita]